MGLCDGDSGLDTIDSRMIAEYFYSVQMNFPWLTSLHLVVWVLSSTILKSHKPPYCIPPTKRPCAPLDNLWIYCGPLDNFLDM